MFPIASYVPRICVESLLPFALGLRNLMERVSNVCLAIFTMLAQATIKVVSASWAFLKRTFSQVVYARPTSVDPQLLFRNMPQETEPFIQRSIEILQTLLQAQQDKRLPELRKKYGATVVSAYLQHPDTIPDKVIEQFPLIHFNQSWESQDSFAFVYITKAFVKAYVLSDARFHAPFFTQTIKVPGEFLEPVYDNHGTLVHAGGQQMRREQKDHAISLRALSRQFLVLPTTDQELICSWDGGPIDQMSLSSNGKSFFHTIDEVASQLLQAPSFWVLVNRIRNRHFP